MSLNNPLVFFAALVGCIGIGGILVYLVWYVAFWVSRAPRRSSAADGERRVEIDEQFHRIRTSIINLKNGQEQMWAPRKLGFRSRTAPSGLGRHGSSPSRLDPGLEASPTGLPEIAAVSATAESRPRKHEIQSITDGYNWDTHFFQLSYAGPIREPKVENMQEMGKNQNLVPCFGFTTKPAKSREQGANELELRGKGIISFSDVDAGV